MNDYWSELISRWNFMTVLGNTPFFGGHGRFWHFVSGIFPGKENSMGKILYIFVNISVIFFLDYLNLKNVKLSTLKQKKALSNFLSIFPKTKFQ